jgi:hypothetical protein
VSEDRAYGGIRVISVEEPPPGEVGLIRVVSTVVLGTYVSALFYTRRCEERIPSIAVETARTCIEVLGSA